MNSNLFGILLVSGVCLAGLTSFIANRRQQRELRREVETVESLRQESEVFRKRVEETLMSIDHGLVLAKAQGQLLSSLMTNREVRDVIGRQLDYDFELSRDLEQYSAASAPLNKCPRLKDIVLRSTLDAGRDNRDNAHLAQLATCRAREEA